jgi:hypothetical protein
VSVACLPVRFHYSEPLPLPGCAFSAALLRMHVPAVEGRRQDRATLAHSRQAVSACCSLCLDDRWRLVANRTVLLSCRPETVAVIAGMPALEQLALAPTEPYVPLPDVRAKKRDTAAHIIHMPRSCFCCSVAPNAMRSQAHQYHRRPR